MPSLMLLMKNEHSQLQLGFELFAGFIINTYNRHTTDIYLPRQEGRM